MTRLAYLDWLRGVAVLIMIEGHARDSWTRLADRDRTAYQWLNILSGFGAPIFLFLAGISLSLAASSRRRKGVSESKIGAAAVRRGLVIFGLAFLFRFQSWIISGGAPQALLKVDILNVMGLSMIVAALLWWSGWGPRSRAVCFVAAAVIVAMVTPIVRAHPALEGLPDAVERYVRPVAGQGTFTLMPWSGFLLAGGAVGIWLDAARHGRSERLIAMALAALGVGLAGGSYAASFLPPLYADVNFWTTSPAFFFLRLGIVIATLAAAYALNTVVRAPRLEEFGRASLFVYWIHVEMAYGILSLPLHRRLTLEQEGFAFVAFTVFLYAIVLAKTRVVARIAIARQNSSVAAGIGPVSEKRPVTHSRPTG